MSRYHVQARRGDEPPASHDHDDCDAALRQALALAVVGAWVIVYSHDHYAFRAGQIGREPRYLYHVEVRDELVAHYKPGGFRVAAHEQDAPAAREVVGSPVR